jgi:hypothetical protein
MSANDYITVPTHPRLLLQAHPSDKELVALHYIGDAEDLIAAGVATAEMLAPNQKKGPRPRGPNGERYSVDRYYSVRNGQPIRRCRPGLWKVRKDAIPLPGALEALRAHEAAMRAADAREAERAHRELTAALIREREWEAQSDREDSVTLH